ncbi:MAG: multiheme c-type cytochrome [bacterium]
MRPKLILLSVPVIALIAFCNVARGQDTTYVGATGNFPACNVCHSSSSLPEFTQWMGTAHATAYDSALAVVKNSAECLQCHTTGWDTTKANLGADDFVVVDPDTEGARFNISFVSAEDSTNFLKKANVQCEACHGPASFHPTNTTEKPPTRIDAEQCGQCHQDEHHPFIEEWRQSKHAISNTHASGFLQGKFRNDPNCSGCHTFQGFIQFVGTTTADTLNLEPDVVGPGDNSLPIVCATCHDPHDAKHEGQLRLEVVDLCAKCHQPEEAAPPETPHHSTASVFDGVGAYEFEGVTFRKQSTHQLMPLIQEKKCVACHVHMEPFDGSDPNNPIPAVTGHTFNPRINACTQSGCHVGGLVETGGREFNHRGRQAFTENLVDSLTTILASIETDILPTATAEDSFDYQIGLFNLEYVENEGSHGVHNANYVEDILTNTIAFLDTAIMGPTSVEETDGFDGVPVSFELYQNFPNPFNPATHIRFDVPTASHVKLTIYNALGQVVETLVDERLAAKSYEVDFNASHLSSGLYFYRVEAANFISVKKMLLLK